MTNFLKYAGCAIVALVVGVLLAPVVQPMLGGVYNQVEQEFYQGLKVGTSNQLVIDSDGDITTAIDVDGDVTVGGGTVSVTTSNSATSTLEVGCVEATATSTATPVKFLLHASTSITAASSYGGGTQIGFVTFGYGSCPAL